MGGIPTNYHGEVLSPTTKDQHRTAPGLMAIGGQHVCLFMEQTAWEQTLY